MSKYDRSDPGQDPAYCDGLAAEDDDDTATSATLRKELDDLRLMAAAGRFGEADIDSVQDRIQAIIFALARKTQHAVKATRHGN